MAHDAQLRVIQGTTTDLGAGTSSGEGPCDVWGVIIEGTTTGVTQVALHDNVSTTLTVLVFISTSLTNATAFEKQKAVMFPRPVRFSKAMSVDVTGTERFFIYVAGFRQN